MNTRTIHRISKDPILPRDGVSQISQIVDANGIQGSVVNLSKIGLLLFSSWQTYLKYQPDDVMSDVPHFKSRLEFYLKNKWTINQAWVDFQKIIAFHADAIIYQTGRKGFNIPNFSVSMMSYEIFRLLLIETAQSAEIGIGEAIRLSNQVPDRVDDLLNSGTTSELDSTQIDPEDDIVTQSAELMPLSDDYHANSSDQIEIFQTEMIASFENMGLVPLGEKSLEIILQSALQEYISLNFCLERQEHIQWFKNKIHGGQNHNGSVHYRLSAAVSDQLGENLKSLLTSLSATGKLSQFINMKLFEDQTQIPDFHFYELVLDFQIWTLKYGKEKPQYSSRNSVVLKVVQDFE